MMNKSRFQVKMIFLVLAFVLNGTAYSQITSQILDSVVLESIEKFDIAGISVGIVKDGEIIFARGYGVKSISTKKKVDENTSFGIGSNTKAFTTAALAILVDEGKLAWSDKVQKHIPEFTMYNSYVAQNFTIEDLLCHRSGLGLGIGDLMLFPDGSDFTTADILASFQYFKPTSAFRTKFDYDNLLYVVAGEVVARLSGMSWEAFVQERILNELKMSYSFADISEISKRKNVSASHSTEGEEMEEISPYMFDTDKMNGALGSI
ncbi:MAG: beta-lactamase family protein, partial [Bacteroidales bacterium]|nr:beta-lactamase family protein [Bacteroidales bacterium]